MLLFQCDGEVYRVNEKNELNSKTIAIEICHLYKN